MPSVTQDTDTAHVAFFLTVLKLRQRKSPVGGATGLSGGDAGYDHPTSQRRTYHWR
jgi:hypothetical protein